MKRRSAISKVLAILMSILLAVFSLMPVTPGHKVYADAAPSPVYTGPLTWKDYTAPASKSMLERVDFFLPNALAFDQEDNAYVTKINNNIINPTIVAKVERISNEGQSVTDITYNAALQHPFGIAVDPEGNLYISDNSEADARDNVATLWMLPRGADEWVDITKGAAFKYALGVAADQQGNVYAIDGGDNSSSPAAPPRILKLLKEAPSWVDITGASSPLSRPYDIAVDGEGNVIVSDAAARIYKLPVHDENPAWTNIAPASFIPTGIGMDNFDQLYALNAINGKVIKLPPSGGPDDWSEIETTSDPLGSQNLDVAADSSGHLYKLRMHIDGMTMHANVYRLMAILAYDGNGNTGGTVPADNAGYKPNGSATVSGNPGHLAKTGYTFEGWNTSADGEGDFYAPGDAIEMKQNITLYASWAPIPSLTSIALDSTSYTLRIGATHQTVTTAVYSDHSRYELSSGVLYTSSNTAVATVNSTGLVTARSGGHTVITSVYQGKQAEATVTVEFPASNNPDSTTVTPPATNNPGIEIIVDGVKQEQLATARQDTVNGQTVTTVVLDSRKVTDKLQRENNKLLTIPINGNHPVVVGELNGSLVKALESNDAQIQIATDKATYTLPASQIHIDGISAQVGTGVKLEDITVRIRISETSDDKTAQVQAAAERNHFDTLVRPVDFEISASYGSQTVQANKFNSYVGRLIALPEGTNTENITTGVVLTADGELFHVPTTVVQQDGKSYALINSLTNSTYSVIYNPREMNDVQGHWAKADVNDMSSRLIVQGVTATEFQPDASITRAEFASIVTRALGIQGVTHKGIFSDVVSNSWYAGAVQAAADYKLIEGYSDGTFRPNQKITRQEATAVLARATGIAKLKSDLPAAEVSRLLSAFTDGSQVADWARSNVAAVVSLNLIYGRDGKLDLKADLTRAETAALVRRLLQSAKLINS